ncbi:hypothetical protein ABK046_47430, partial [Streptomyces caeruleatus]
ADAVHSTELSGGSYCRIAVSPIGRIVRGYDASGSKVSGEFVSFTDTRSAWLCNVQNELGILPHTP